MSSLCCHPTSMLPLCVKWTRFRISFPDDIIHSTNDCVLSFFTVLSTNYSISYSSLSFSRHLGFKTQQNFFKLARATQRLGQLSVQQDLSTQLNLAATMLNAPQLLPQQLLNKITLLLCRSCCPNSYSTRLRCSYVEAIATKIQGSSSQTVGNGSFPFYVDFVLYHR